MNLKVEVRRSTSSTSCDSKLGLGVSDSEEIPKGKGQNRSYQKENMNLTYMFEAIGIDPKNEIIESILKWLRNYEAHSTW